MKNIKIIAVAIFLIATGTTLTSSCKKYEEGGSLWRTRQKISNKTWKLDYSYQVHQNQIDLYNNDFPNEIYFAYKSKDQVNLFYINKLEAKFNWSIKKNAVFFSNKKGTITEKELAIYEGGIKIKQLTNKDLLIEIKLANDSINYESSMVQLKYSSYE